MLAEAVVRAQPRAGGKGVVGSVSDSDLTAHVEWSAGLMGHVFKQPAGGTLE